MIAILILVRMVAVVLMESIATPVLVQQDILVTTAQSILMIAILILVGMVAIVLMESIATPVLVQQDILVTTAQ